MGLREQIRKLCEVDCHAASLVTGHAIHSSSAARFILSVEPADRTAACIIDAITAISFDDGPRGGEAAGCCHSRPARLRQQQRSWRRRRPASGGRRNPKGGEGASRRRLRYLKTPTYASGGVTARFTHANQVRRRGEIRSAVQIRRTSSRVTSIRAELSPRGEQLSNRMVGLLIFAVRHALPPVQMTQPPSGSAPYA